MFSEPCRASDVREYMEAQQRIFQMQLSFASRTSEVLRQVQDGDVQLAAVQSSSPSHGGNLGLQQEEIRIVLSQELVDSVLLIN